MNRDLQMQFFRYFRGNVGLLLKRGRQKRVEERIRHHDTRLPSYQKYK